MKVIILAAGEGKRLRPFTLERPKCMVEIGGKSLLERQLLILDHEEISDSDASSSSSSSSSQSFELTLTKPATTTVLPNINNNNNKMRSVPEDVVVPNNTRHRSPTRLRRSFRSLSRGRRRTNNDEEY